MPAVSKLYAELGIDTRPHDQGLDRAEDRQEEFVRKSKRSGDKAAKGLFDAFSKADHGAITSLGQNLSLGLTTPILGFAAASLKAAVDADTLKRTLTSMAGSTQEAESQLKRLEAIGKGPGLGFDQAVQGSIRLQGVGFSAGEAERALKAAGNAVATAGGNADALDGVILALTQIEGKGKVSAEEVNQIAERFPKIRMLMKDAFGTADTEELQKMGLESREFIDKILVEMEKLPKVAAGAREGIEDLGATAKKSLAKVGDNGLRLLVPVLGKLGDLTENLASGFDSLPPATKGVIAAVATMAAVTGPTILGFGTLGRSVKDLKEGWSGLVEMKGAAATFFSETIKGLLGTTTQSTAAAGARTLYTRTVDENTGRIVYNTTAVGRNSAALQGNAASAATAARSQGMLGAVGANAGRGIGVMGSLGVAALTVGSAITIAHAGGNWKDKQEGKEGVSFEDTLKHINPFSQTNELPGTSKAEAKAGLAAMGETPRQKLLREQSARVKAEKQFKEEERQKIEDAEFRAQLDQAQSLLASVPKEGKAESELKSLLPLIDKRQAVLKKRAEELKPKIKENAEKAVDYWEIQSDLAGLAEQGEALKAQAAEAAKEKADRAKQIAKEIGETQFNIAVARARDLVSDSPEETRAREEAESVIPVLKARLAQLGQEARNLFAEAQKGGEKALEYWRTQSEGWQVQSQINSLLKGAVREETAEIEKADKEARELFKAQGAASAAEFKAMVAGFPEEQRARMEAAEGIAGAKETQAEMLANLREMAPGSKEYFQQLAEYWKSTADVKKMERAAQKEADNEQKRARDEAQKAAGEQRQLLDLRTKLFEAQIKNNPFLNDAQRQKALVPFLIQQYAQAKKAVAGETEQQRLQREIEAEGLKGQVWDTLGVNKAGFARFAGGGRMPLFDRRRAMNVMGEFSRIDGAPNGTGSGNGSGSGSGNRIFSTASGQRYYYPNRSLATMAQPSRALASATAAHVNQQHGRGSNVLVVNVDSAEEATSQFRDWWRRGR